MTILPDEGSGNIVQSSRWNTLLDKIQTADDTDVCINGSYIKEASRRLISAGTGSPSTWGYFTQAGKNATGAGSNAWVSFGTAFTSTPISIIVNEVDTIGEWAHAGSWTPGSFYLATKSATKNVGWAAWGAL